MLNVKFSVYCTNKEVMGLKKIINTGYWLGVRHIV